MSNTLEAKKTYCIFHLAPDKEPAWYDDNDLPVTYNDKREAISEILQVYREHILQIETGERDIEDGIGYNDWVEEVTVREDGTIIDKDGNIYGKRD